MPGGGCRGGMPGLGPCMSAGPGKVIAGNVGEPGWLLPLTSKSVPLSPLESPVHSSGRCTVPAVEEDTTLLKLKIKYYVPVGCVHSTVMFNSI